jgi:hypothetical protein
MHRCEEYTIATVAVGPDAERILLAPKVAVERGTDILWDDGADPYLTEEYALLAGAPAGEHLPFVGVDAAAKVGIVVEGLGLDDATIATTRRHYPDRSVEDAQRELKAVKLAEHIKRLVDAAPPLTAEQRDRLAALLRPVRGGRA